jgi:ATP-dependent Clp protease ATP-binding subunit ClpA
VLSEPKVTIYYGPLSWFEEQLAGREHENLLDLFLERDEQTRRHTHVVQGQEVENEDETEPPDVAVAYSADYATLAEHVLSNFSGHVRQISPHELLLHNPPTQVADDVARVFPTTTRQYNYPAVTRETLKRIRIGFADHLLGQEAVRNRLLASLYPLVTQKRADPVVVMFYGPSGVGKTETAKFVNGLLGGELLRKQFSMFHSEKFASYLFGGKHSEPAFARDLLDRESGVILIDEFDKANAVFHSAFYQLFDEGLYVDKNNTVHVGPALIICTSNYASEREVQEALGEALYSRFDAVIGFDSLSEEHLIQVIDRLIDERLLTLDDADRGLLDPAALRRYLHPAAGRTGNVRHLSKIVDELVGLLLVDAMFTEEESDEDPALAGGQGSAAE